MYIYNIWCVWYDQYDLMYDVYDNVNQLKVFKTKCLSQSQSQCVASVLSACRSFKAVFLFL